jgi:hypothetical protein
MREVSGLFRERGGEVRERTELEGVDIEERVKD